MWLPVHDQARTPQRERAPAPVHRFPIHRPEHRTTSDASSMGWRELHERGAAHRGAVGPRCARAADVPPSRFRSWARRAELDEPFPDVFVLPGWPVDRAARTFAASLALGRDTVITGWGALAQLGLTTTWPRVPELLVPATARGVHLTDVRTRWTRELATDPLVDVSGVRFTDAARSLAHLAERVASNRLRALAFDAVNRGLLSVDRLDAEIAARGRFAGRTTIRELARDLEGDGSESGFEFDARARLRQVGLRPDDEQPRVTTRSGRTRRIDIAFGHRHVGIECVGFGYHSSPAQLEADAKRANDIAELDRWLILQLTWRMFHDGWPAFVAQLRRCLDARAAR